MSAVLDETRPWPAVIYIERRHVRRYVRNLEIRFRPGSWKTSPYRKKGALCAAGINGHESRGTTGDLYFTTEQFTPSSSTRLPSSRTAEEEIETRGTSLCELILIRCTLIGTRNKRAQSCRVYESSIVSTLLMLVHRPFQRVPLKNYDRSEF